MARPDPAAPTAMATRRTSRALAGLGCLLVVSGCSVVPSPPAPGPSAPTGPATAVTSAAPTTPVPTEPPQPACTAAAVALSRAERAGQVLMVGVTGSLDDVERAALGRHHVGSVLYIGTSTVGVKATAARSAQVRRAGGDGVLVAVDQEGGLVQRLQGPGFATIPSAAAQADLSAVELTEAATGWGRQLTRAGVNLNLAPVADVVPRAKQRSNAPIGALGRGYGSRPQAVATHVLAFIDGMHAGAVGAAVKHFPGLGEVVGNTDHTADVVDTVTTADSASLTPFRKAAAAGVEAVMVASARYPRIDPDRIGVFSAKVIAILRDWGYDGVVISDDLGAAAALRAVPAGVRAVRFVAAGGDLAITADAELVPAMAAGLVARAKREPVFDARLVEATARVLALKQALGLPGC